uniref:Uncharacterized protein n=1 Tax=Brassica oleracea TaxID=3712 RepID=A0A3P6GJ03_BRAOL|nr:unnamed protein product [Brassica oleracea]
MKKGQGGEGWCGVSHIASIPTLSEGAGPKEERL